MLTETLLVLAFTLIVILVKRVHEAFQFFQKRKIKHLKPNLIFGNVTPVWLNQKHFTEVQNELCKTFPDEPLLGYYDLTKPWYVVQDAEWAEKILIKDFVHFVDHGFEVSEEKNPIDAQLFTLCGNRWRAFRYKLSPIFTSGKLKNMFEVMSECGDNFMQHLSNKKHYREVNLKEELSAFSTDMVASSVFGIQPNTIENPNSEFRKMGKQVFDIGLMGFLRIWIMSTFPWLAKKLGLSFSSQKVVNYFTQIIKDTFHHRREHKIHRNDFVQMMIQLQDKGKVEIQNWDANDDYLKPEESINTNLEIYEVSENIVIAQAFTFLTTGLDIIGNTQLFVFYELCQNPKIQEKVREEILEQVKAHGGLNYDALKGMVYLEKCIKESLRLHATPQLFRICTKDYTFPNGYVIKKGEVLQIAVMAIHTNPDYHPDPEVFKPERFDFPMKSGTWLPFGEGPRICIALRFAILQTKFGIARILMKYRLRLNPKTKLPLKLMPQSILIEPKDPLYFDFEEL